MWEPEGGVEFMSTVALVWLQRDSRRPSANPDNCGNGSSGARLCSGAAVRCHTGTMAV